MLVWGEAKHTVRQILMDLMTKTRVIVITGYATIETAKEAEIVGAFDFICKPFQLQEMYTLIKKAAKKARRSS